MASKTLLLLANPQVLSMSKTVEEISRATGFSITTVRFVINGQSEKFRISAKTRKLIEDYIAVHGYSLNYAARSLKLKRSDTIGFVVPDLANAFFARLMSALEILCRKRDLLLLTVASHEDPELENRAIANLLARGVDGLVIAPCQTATLPKLLENKARTPIVMFDRDYGSLHYPTVLSDNYQGGLEMTRRMLQQEVSCHFLCGHAESPSIQDRIRGFSAACAEKGIPESGDQIRLDAEDSTAAGRQLMHVLIDELQHPPRAFMCSSLLVLEGALQQIKSQIGSIDKAILIGTFDDHTMLDLLPNRVLSIRQDEAALAERVFERLIEPMSGKKRSSPHDIVPCRLICRNL
jgi:LacI family fructose operon transcriptional repressor